MASRKGQKGGKAVHKEPQKPHECNKDSCWLNEHGALIDYTETAEAPCKDFYHIFVTPDQFIIRVWKIVPPTRPDSSLAPSEMRNTWEEFLYDEQCHSEIQRLAGNQTLDFLLSVAEGKLDYLPRVPKPALVKMMMYLDLEDIARLRLVSKSLRFFSDCNELWEKIYRLKSKTPVTPELEMLAKEQTWKKLFFTNKLQLQMHLRRQAHKHQQPSHPPEGGYAFITNPDEPMKTS